MLMRVAAGDGDGSVPPATSRHRTGLSRRGYAKSARTTEVQYRWTLVHRLVSSRSAEGPEPPVMLAQAPPESLCALPEDDVSAGGAEGDAESDADEPTHGLVGEEAEEWAQRMATVCGVDREAGPLEPLTGASEEDRETSVLAHSMKGLKIGVGTKAPFHERWDAQWEPPQLNAACMFVLVGGVSTNFSAKRGLEVKVSFKHGTIIFEGSPAPLALNDSNDPIHKMRVTIVPSKVSWLEYEQGNDDVSILQIQPRMTPVFQVARRSGGKVTWSTTTDFTRARTASQGGVWEAYFSAPNASKLQPLLQYYKFLGLGSIGREELAIDAQAPAPMQPEASSTRGGLEHGRAVDVEPVVAHPGLVAWYLEQLQDLKMQTSRRLRTMHEEQEQRHHSQHAAPRLPSRADQLQAIDEFLALSIELRKEFDAKCAQESRTPAVDMSTEVQTEEDGEWLDSLPDDPDEDERDAGTGATGGMSAPGEDDVEQRERD